MPAVGREEEQLWDESIDLAAPLPRASARCAGRTGLGEKVDQSPDVGFFEPQPVTRIEAIDPAVAIRTPFLHRTRGTARVIRCPEQRSQAVCELFGEHGGHPSRVSFCDTPPGRQSN
jgi:hypothetical protein